jgi:hypothetical protein
VSAEEEEQGLDISMHNERFSGHVYKEKHEQDNSVFVDEESQKGKVDEIPKRV